MNGTQLFEQFNNIREFGKLEYTDTAEFCQAAYRNRHIAFANIKTYYDEEENEYKEESPSIRELGEILENKIKENIYDNEAIQIASAGSSGLLCKRRDLFTPKIVAHSLDDLLSSE